MKIHLKLFTLEAMNSWSVCQTRLEHEYCHTGNEYSVFEWLLEFESSQNTHMLYLSAKKYMKESATLQNDLLAEPTQTTHFANSYILTEQMIMNLIRSMDWNGILSRLNKPLLLSSNIIWHKFECFSFIE